MQDLHWSLWELQGYSSWKRATLPRWITRFTGLLPKTGPCPSDGDFSRNHTSCSFSGSGGSRSVSHAFLTVLRGRNEVPSVTERWLFCFVLEGKQDSGPGMRVWPKAGRYQGEWSYWLLSTCRESSPRYLPTLSSQPPVCIPSPSNNPQSLNAHPYRIVF